MTSGFEMNESELSEHDALEAEISAFLNSVASGAPPVVTGEDGRLALEIAYKILESLEAQSAKVKAHSERKKSA